MKRLNKAIRMIALVALVASCTEYLDVVPDNTLKLENIFSTKDEAYNALAKIYHYLPDQSSTHNTDWLLGDEFIGRIDPDMQNNTGELLGERIMRGLQVTGEPLLGNWHQYYLGISSTNIFLHRIDATRNISDIERSNWKAQAIFLKAYYHFLLLQKYGPIILSDEEITPDASEEELFQSRSKVDDCFDYIIRLIDEAIPNLTERSEEVNLGQIDRIVATAIKARVLLFRASPFYSGNREFFDDFLDKDGKPFFPIGDTPERSKEKWNEAITAINAAIDLARINGKDLYQYEKEPYVHDRAFCELNPDQMKTYYDLRMLVVDPWNKELLWGYSNINIYGQGELAHATNLRLPTGLGDDSPNESSYSWQWLAATYRMTERYYTQNGLPIDEDLTFNYNTRQDTYRTTGVEEPDYPEIAGLMQPNQSTINLYMNREMRFYANLGITGGYYRSHFTNIPLFMMAGLYGGYNPSINGTDFYCTGIALQKFVHPESKSGAWQRTIKFPYPLIRMADLYLMKAEALNEYKDVPDQEVWDAVNLVRARAGIPNVETVWSDPALARTPDKHTTKSGMRDIILRERAVELAFEGSHFWDMIRHKKAHVEFSTPIQGWNYKGTSPATFFVLGVVQARRFTIRDYLWPISLTELNTNGKLIQNPGW